MVMGSSMDSGHQIREILLIINYNYAANLFDSIFSAFEYIFNLAV